jgi:PD-(D/E)XK nuclease superfamily
MEDSVNPQSAQPADLAPAKFPVALTNSMVRDFVACPFKWYLSYCLRLSPAVENIHLAAGGSFASGLKAARLAFYSDKESQEDALCEGVKALLMDWPFDDARAETTKSLPAVVMAFADYLDHYPFATDMLKPAKFHDGRLGIEFSFSNELPISHPQTGEPLLYCGRADMLASIDDFLVITDEKTTSSLGAGWANRFRLNGQFLGYVHSARQHGYEVLGCFIRGIAIRNDRTDIAQTTLLPGKVLIETWYRDLLRHVGSMVTYWHLAQRRIDPVRVYGEACSAYGGCQYDSVCFRGWSPSLEGEIPQGFIQQEKLYVERASEAGVQSGNGSTLPN